MKQFLDVAEFYNGMLTRMACLRFYRRARIALAPGGLGIELHPMVKLGSLEISSMGLARCEQCDDLPGLLRRWEEVVSYRRRIGTSSWR